MEWRDPVVLELCRRHQESDPETVIRRLCRELLDACPTESGATPLRVLGSIRLIRDVHHRPIDPAAGCSGLLVEVNGGYEVTLNNNEPAHRENWSLAHEIVHTFFRDVEREAKPTTEEERLCDLGARELTMPADRFMRSLADVGLSFGGIRALHDEFEASFVAAGRRAAELTDEVACFLRATRRRTKDQERWDVGTPLLRIDYWTASRSWPEPRNYKSTAFAPGCLVHQAFDHQDERAGRAELGTNRYNGTYTIEATGYTYGAAPDHQRCVVALLTDAEELEGSVAA